MATVTLVESAKLAQNELVAGVIESIITVNRMFEVLPFDGIDGNALAYNRENVLGDVQSAAPGDVITAKNPASFTQVTSSLTSIIGDAEVNGLIQVTRSNDGNDQTAIQIASKAKSCGRQFQTQMITGDGTSNTITGLQSLVTGGQTIHATGTNGDSLGFTVMDNLMDLVIDKDGDVDYFAMHARTIRSYMALLRGLGGANITETVDLPSGMKVPSYRMVPIFRNDYIPLTLTTGSASTCTEFFAGTLDDGSRSYGIAGLTAQNSAGIQVVDVGEKEATDDHLWRVKWYCGLANFSAKGLTMADGILN